ncbi:MAG: hypothetical protein QOI84_707, partial [Solirubrobacterales bacterium]|nr:hypothetical protein [Solirubrobacterales bacterium]
MAELHVLRVFTGEEGEWGNPLGVFLNGAEIPPAERLRPPAGEVEVRREGELTFVAAEAEWSPPWRLFKLGGPRAVEALAGPPAGAELAYLWAWEDEAAGTVRSRCFS